MYLSIYLSIQLTSSFRRGTEYRLDSPASSQLPTKQASSSHNQDKLKDDRHNHWGNALLDAAREKGKFTGKTLNKSFGKPSNPSRNR